MQALKLLAIGYGALGAATVVYADENPAAEPQTPQKEIANAGLQEVLVTATRRTQAVQDVPYNIATIGGDALAQSGVTSINNLAQLVPGLQYVDNGPNPRGGNNQFSMRGLRTDAPGGESDIFRSGTVAPVSTYWGETPIFFPMALTDLERVEVLKGPQGTLYGSGALAGTIRFIPKRPEFDKFSASLDIQGGTTEYSGKLNGSADVAINAPLTDNLALRVAAGYQELGGFIDAVDLVQRSVPGGQSSAPVLRVPTDPRSGYALAPVMHDTNWSQRWYVRPVLRWKASDAIDAELSYTHQRVAVGGIPIQNASYPGGTYLFDSVSGNPNAVNYYRPGGPYKGTTDMLEPGQNELDLGALVVTADLGSASLTSSSSVYRTDSKEAQYYVDSSQIFNADGSLAFNYYDYWNNYPRGNMQTYVQQRDQSFIQEVRLISTWHKPIDYIVGGYYQTEHFNFANQTTEPGYTQYLTAINGTGLPRPNGDLQYYYPPSSGFTFTDRALFGELTWHIMPPWQVTGGVRFFWQDFRNRQTAYDYYYVGSGTVDLDVDNSSKVKDHIVKLNTSYDFTSDLKLYATYSEGFRRGGANAVPLAGQFASLPQLLNYTPDKSKNYEVGVKGRLFDRALQYTVDVFFIKLDNFQFNSFSGSGFPVVFNGTEAHSKGAEFETEFQITHQLLLGLSYAYTEATVPNGFTVYDYVPLTLITNPNAPQLTPVATVASGDRLPTTPKNSANVMLNYNIPLGSVASVLLHADLAYRGSAPAYIDPTSQFYWVIPSSTVVNGRITYDSGQKWAADLFVNNLTNETVYSGGFGSLQTMPSLFQERFVGRPRTYGVGLHYKW
jgi:outer membrane receptor protein involved in Fe transport